MLVYPDLLLSLRCPACPGQFIFRTVNPFALFSGEKLDFSCSDGREVFAAQLISKNRLRLKTIGSCCADPHFNDIDPGFYKKTPAFYEILCAETEISLGYLGSPEMVAAAVNADFTEAVRYCGELLRVFWQRPDLIGMIFCRLTSLYAKRQVFCRHCGSFNIDIETARHSNLELICADCKVSATIYAERDVNWHIVKDARAVLLDKKGARLKIRR